jgi:phage tail sheath protein FI
VTIDAVGTSSSAMQALLDTWGAHFLGPEGIAAAAYYPWVLIADPWNPATTRLVPPSGTIAGVYATTDTTRGVWEAPAGVTATLEGVTGLADPTIDDDVNGELNVAGIDVLRTFPDYGPVCWGARTLAGADSIASEFKYVPVRRLADLVHQSIRRGLAWAAFEPNAPALWASIASEVGQFMQGLFTAGAFSGATPTEAYLVECDASTTTQDDIEQGVVNVKVAFAPLRPAEFVVLTITVAASAP